MASLGVLASLMQTMTPQMPQYNPMEEAQQQAVLQGRRSGNETALLQLADLKAKQQAEALMFERIQTDPELARQLLGGGSILGSLGPAGAPPGAPPMTQQAVQPGMPPGAPTVVPGGQDLSQFATQGGPPQSTLASLGPQPQGQGQQNPLLEMARTNPRAALMLSQQLEQRQDLAIKRQEQQLGMGVKVLGYVGQQAQGVSDQASLDALRSDLQSQGLGKYAAQLPQLYSKEAMAPFIAKALAVKDKLTLDIAAMNEQTDMRKQQFAERQAAASIPEYVKGEGPLNAWIDTLMQRAGIPRGTTPPADILEQAQKNVQEGKIAVSASQGTGQIVKGPTGNYIRVNPRTNQVEEIKGPGGEPLREKPSETEQKGATLANSVAAANKLATELEDKGYKPSVWEKGLDKLPLGLGNYVTSSDYQKYRQTVREFASAWLYGVSGAQITDSEWENANQTFFPQPNEDKGAVELKRQRRAALVEELRQQSGATGRTGTQGQPQGQGQAPAAQGNQPAGAKVVTRAALHAEAARRGVSPEQAEAMARQKGYEVR